MEYLGLILGALGGLTGGGGGEQAPAQFPSLGNGAPQAKPLTAAPVRSPSPSTSRFLLNQDPNMLMSLFGGFAG